MEQRVQWLYVDLNSYFASVEQELQPKLRGRPVGVLPVMAETTCCIAASYQAKKFGVKTGTMVSEARRLCPEIQFVEARHEHYVRYHHAIIEAVGKCLPVEQVCSIDEIACRLMGGEQLPENAAKLARDVKKKIFSVGSQLSCSVGLAPNRYLAKVAADMQKPDGLTTLTPAQLPQALLPLKLSDFPGVGRRMEERLREAGIVETSQLLNLSELEMRKVWSGIWGERMYRWLRGHDFDVTFGEHKSIGHSHVLPPEFRSPDGAFIIAQRLLQKAAVRLRKINYWASGLALSVRYTDRTRWKKDLKMLECQDTLTLLEVLRELWRGQPNRKIPIKVSITLYGLVSDKERTLSFFDQPKRVQLSHAMDKLNHKYGKSTVYFGGIHNALAAAPMRIAFTNIPELED